jgi:membrane-associated protein
MSYAAGDVLAFNPLNAKDWINAVGIVGILLIIFAETGLLVGFFFPGDSLLFIAGVATTPVMAEVFDTRLSLPVLLIGTPICAILGAQLGHYLGDRYGRRMFDRPNSRIFKPEYVEKAEYYFNKFGPAKAVVLARFIPIVRTFLNPVAGVLEMPARRFFVWNVVGGVFWTVSLILLGALVGEQLGANFPIDRYIIPAVAVIVLISLIPVFIEVYRGRKEKKRAALETAAHD